MIIDKLIKGNKKFKNSKFIKLESKFNNLVQFGQKPQVLFIGCSDSRVVPDLIVDTKPGDMFILRNIGNFVPPYKKDKEFHGSSAAIEYAVSVLGVKDIIVCGHSYCGACAALYDDLSEDDELIHVRKWLELGKKAKKEAKKSLVKKDKKNKEKLFRLTERASIKHQLENLLTYPAVYEKVKNKQLDIHGWYYKIEDGTIEYYDGASGSFKLLGN
jgi:carbonic anhydrase